MIVQPLMDEANTDRFQEGNEGCRAPKDDSAELGKTAMVVDSDMIMCVDNLFFHELVNGAIC
jgi:hypothetical protein